MLATRRIGTAWLKPYKGIFKAVPFICTVALLPFAKHILGQEALPKSARASSIVYVGLIEDDRRQLAELGVKDNGPVPNRTVTPAFEKLGNEWKPIVELNEKVNWTVSFDGKSLGQVQSEPMPLPRGSKGIPGPSHPHSILTPSDKIPVVGEPGETFNGDFGSPVRRPLVVVSRDNFSDPDGWKRTKLPAEVVSRVRNTFRKSFNHLRFCDASGKPLAKDATVDDSDVEVRKAYRSNKEVFLVETELKKGRCAYSENSGALTEFKGNQWFYVKRGSEASYLGKHLQLVDAGDYDGDGKSELIFYVSEGPEEALDNEGYLLFYDGFTRRVTFTWNDH